jgi:hypothetical protein
LIASALNFFAGKFQPFTRGAFVLFTWQFIIYDADKSFADAVQFHFGREALNGFQLTVEPTALDELDNQTAMAVANGTQHGTERGSGFAFAVAGIDEHQAARFGGFYSGSFGIVAHDGLIRFGKDHALIRFFARDNARAFFFGAFERDDAQRSFHLFLNALFIFGIARPMTEREAFIGGDKFF